MNTTDMSPLGRLDRTLGVRLQARARDAWRDAELQVQARWDAYVDADREASRDAFVAYLAALDAEASAAAALAQTHLDPAAAA